MRKQKLFRVVVFVSLGFTLANTQDLPSSFKQQGRLLCQGEYSSVVNQRQDAPEIKLMDKWQMYTLLDGSYSVDVELVTFSKNGATFKERHVFSHDMQPTSFQMIVSDSSDAADPQSMILSCDYRPADIACRTKFEGRVMSATLAQEKPYLFWPTADAPAFDMMWADQMLVTQFVHMNSAATAVPLITIKDGDDPNDLDGFAIAMEEMVQVEYLGRETIEILKQPIAARKFRMKSGEGEDSVQEYWMSDSGLLLKTTSEGWSIILTRYEGPELK